MEVSPNLDTAKPFRGAIIISTILCCFIALLDGPGVTNPIPGFALLSVGLLSLLAAVAVWRLPLPTRRRTAVLLVSALVLWMAMATLFSVDRFASRASMAGWFGGLAVFASLLISIRQAREWRLAAHLVVFATTVVSGMGYLDWFDQIAQNGNKALMRATFSNTDCFSVVPLVGLFLSSGLLPGAPKPGRVLLCIESLLLSGALVASGSRAALFGASAATVVFLGTVVARKQWKSMTEALISFSPALAVLPLMLFSGLLLPTFGRMQDLVNGGEEQGVGLREDVAIHGPSTVLKRPLFGFGPGTFDLAYQQQRPVDGVLAPYMYVNRAHDDFIEVAVEGGFPAIILWVMLLWFSASRAVRFSIKGAMSSESASAAAAVAGVAAYSVLNFAVAVPADLMLWFAAMGLAVSIPVHKESVQEHGRLKATFVALLLGGGAFTIFFGVSAVQANKLVVKVSKLQQDLRWEEALVVLQRALGWQPSRVELLATKSRLEEILATVQGDKILDTVAGEDLERALKLSPRTQSLILLRASYLEKHGKLAESELILKQGLRFAPYQDVFLKQLLELQLRQSEFAEALDSMKDLSQRDISYRKAFIEMLAGVEKVHPGLAGKALERWATDPVGRSVSLGIGREATEMLLSRHLPTTANSLLTSLERLDPTDSGIQVSKARAESMLGHTAASMALLKTVLERKAEESTPDYCRALELWANLKVKEGDSRTVATRLADYLTRNPEMNDIRVVLVDAYLRNKQLEMARTLLDESLQSDPDNALLLTRRGALYARENSPDLAAQYYRRALQRDPLNKEAETGLKALGKD